MKLYGLAFIAVFDVYMFSLNVVSNTRVSVTRVSVRKSLLPYMGIRPSEDFYLRTKSQQTMFKVSQTDNR